MPLPDYKVLSLGCFGTLIDRDAGVLAALRPLVASAGLAATPAELLASFTRHEDAARAAGTIHPYGAVLGAVHRALADEWGVICSDDEHSLFANSVARWPAYADSAGALQYLRRYCRLVVVTDADRESVEAATRRLDVRFDAVVTPKEAGACKPDRRIFLAAVERFSRLGATAGQALHVGRSVAHDVVPAHEAGLAAGWIDRARLGAGADAADYVFHSLAGLVRAHQEQLRA
jgi:2-haloalkanoic acid dehalogenase type II